jgi:hypothetical protein
MSFGVETELQILSHIRNFPRPFYKGYRNNPKHAKVISKRTNRESIAEVLVK